MKNKHILPFLAFFFFVVAAVYLATLRMYLTQSDGWVIGDWLINFQGGFVRRGLCGQMIFGLSSFLHLRPDYLVSMAQTCCFLGCLAVFFALICKKEMDLWFLMAVLSPATFLFPVLCRAASGRKEIIVFFLFGIFILCLNKKWSNKNILVFLFSIALFLATFFHETAFFYSPYFLWAAFLKSKLDGETFDFRKMSVLVVLPFLAILPLFFFGKTINGTAICASLIEKGVPGDICRGILNWSTDYWVGDVFRVAKRDGYFFNYGMALVLGLFPIVFFVKNLKPEIIFLKKFILNFLILFLFSLPLFFVAIDWGRWLNIHFVLLLFTATIFLKNRQRPGWCDEYLSVPKLWETQTKSGRAWANLAFFAIFIAYTTLWSMRHYSVFPLFSARLYEMLFGLVGSFL